MEEIIKQLCERFPLLPRLTVTQAGNNSAPEALPPFLGFLLAVMDAPPDKPLCFVLPRRGDVARLTTVLHALHRFIKKQKQLTYTYGEANFNKGDNVRVHPGKQVFRYDGFDENSSDFIWLKTVDGTGRWQFRAAEIIPRLEKTTRKTPIGRLSSPMDSPPPAPLDVLLETSTFGNLSLVQNEVVLLDSQNGFADFADSASFQRASLMPDMPSLKALLPFGELSPPFSSKQSWLKKWDDRNPAGEPLVAITHSAELLANYCIDAPAKSKLVVINGLSRLKHRQSYDDAAESQRLVLFASRDEEEMIKTLGQAPIPCKFWWLSAAEINAGGGLAGTNGSSGLVNKVVRWANNHERLDIESVPCENQALETVCIRLEELRSQLSDDENDPLTKLTSLAWRMLNDASAIVRPPTAVEQRRFGTQVGSLRAELKNNVWLKPESAKALNDIASAIEASLLADGKLGLSKGAALYRVVRESQTARLKCALLARNENQIDELKFWMRQRSISLEAYSPRTLPEDSSFDRLICVSWPGWYSLKQVADILVAPRITVLAYPFEGRWLSQCKRRLRLRPEAPTVTAAEKTGLVATDKSTPAFWPENNGAEVSPPSTISTDTGIWHFEQRLRAARKGIAVSPAVATDTIAARYVSFVGDFYAFLTESHKLPVATALVSGRARANQKLPERTVLDIKPGDFIVFPESGDREFVLEVADKRIGPPAPKLRTLARKWKTALQKSGLSPEQFHQQAKSFNRPRHIATKDSNNPDLRRFINRDLELTSRIQSSEITNVLQQLFNPYPGTDERRPVDVCLATNMIQVGLDVPRLGLMTVVGQPKTTSEYIQATSRVGRDAKGPGLVVTVFNPGKPRDRSHFEHFRSYHQSIYRWVEPTSVTPFAVPVRERALHAQLVTLARYWGDKAMRENPNPPPNDPLFKRIRDILIQRIEQVDSGESAAADLMLTELIERWRRIQPPIYGHFGSPPQETPLMYPSGTEPRAIWANRSKATPSSMRNVDSGCDAEVISQFQQP